MPVKKKIVPVVQVAGFQMKSAEREWRSPCF